MWLCLQHVAASDSRPCPHPIMSEEKLPTFELRLGEHDKTIKDLTKRLMLLESVAEPIFKSSLAKGASDCLFWSQPSLMNCYASPAKIQHLQRLTELLGGTCDRKGVDAVKLFQLDRAGTAILAKDANVIARAQLPRNGTQHPKFMDPLTSLNMLHVGIENDILQQLRNNVSIILGLLFHLC